jgi:hypothetical protein
MGIRNITNWIRIRIATKRTGVKEMHYHCNQKVLSVSACVSQNYIVH